MALQIMNYFSILNKNELIFVIIYCEETIKNLVRLPSSSAIPAPP